MWHVHLYFLFFSHLGFACSSRPTPPYRRGMEMTRTYEDDEEILIGANVSFRCANGRLFESDPFNVTGYNATCLDGNVWHVPQDMNSDNCVDAYYCPPIPYEVPPGGNVTILSTGRLSFWPPHTECPLKRRIM